MPDELTTSGDVDRSARILHPAGPTPTSLDSDVLVAIAEGLSSTVGPQHAAPIGVIRRVRLLETLAYDSWLMVWGPGATAESHDHDGSICAVHVVDGGLLETVTTLAGERSASWHHGGSTSLAGPTATHQLTNLTDSTAVSVHVFSPPLGDAATASTGGGAARNIAEP